METKDIFFYLPSKHSVAHLTHRSVTITLPILQPLIQEARCANYFHIVIKSPLPPKKQQQQQQQNKQTNNNPPQHNKQQQTTTTTTKNPKDKKTKNNTKQSSKQTKQQQHNKTKQGTMIEAKLGSLPRLSRYSPPPLSHHQSPPNAVTEGLRGTTWCVSTLRSALQALSLNRASSKDASRALPLHSPIFSHVAL